MEGPVPAAVVTSPPSASRPRAQRRRPSGEPPPLPKEMNWIAIGFLIEFGVWAAVWTWIFLSDTPARWITEQDLGLMQPVVDRRVGWLNDVFVSINRYGLPWLTLIVGWCTVIVGLVTKRIRHVLLLIGSLSVTTFVVTIVANQIQRPRPLGMEILGDWEGFAQPSRPMALLGVALVACGLTLVPSGRWRVRWFIAATIAFVVIGFGQVYVAVDHPTDVLAATTVGVATTIVAFRSLAPEQVFPIAYGTGKTAHLDVGGSRGEAIHAALRRQLDIEVTDVRPVGLAGSAGSTPLRIDRCDGPPVFAKLYAQNHLRSDRSYKLGRTLLYGRLEDEQRFSSVRRLIQHEDYLLHVMRAAEVDTLEPISIVEITPDREYLLVCEFLEGAVEISEADVTVDLIDQGLEAVRRLWDAGLAHRDIKPANVMVQGDRLRLIDVGFGEIRPSPWRQAVDLANMMLVLALRSEPELVYRRALRLFSADEIAEAFAASRGVTLPSALRAEVRLDGRRLLHEFRRLAPARAPVGIQRWSLRRVGLTLWVVLVALAMVAIFLGSLPDIGLWP